MKKRRRLFAAGFVCTAVAYYASAVIKIPGLEEGPVKGSLLHRDFGAVEFAEVFALTFVLCVLVALRPVRPFLRAAGGAFGFALFAAGLLLVEARIQTHGILTEHVIQNNFGSKGTVYLTAAAAGVLGLAISAVSIRKVKGR